MARTREFDEQQVLERAVKLFSEKGYNGISMQELVDGLKINRSSIYDSFGDKQDLYLATLKFYRENSSTIMIGMLEQSIDIKKTIKSMFDQIALEAADTKSREGCMMVNSAIELAPHEKKVANLVGENMSSVQSALAKAISKGQSNGQISKKYPADALAHLILTSVNGLRVAEKWGAEKSTYKSVADVVMSML